ncbi:MAG: orotidine-5'-phosphate decarboxylase [Candidatus Competibacterales bacterium]
MFQPVSPLIVALDVADYDAAWALATALDPHRCRLKVGQELFTAAGPPLVERLVAAGFGVFLDLKFHDIPHTVARACRAAAALGVEMVDVHSLGGTAMVAAARDALEAFNPRPRLLAVTLLTSLEADDVVALGVPEAPAAWVLRLARLARVAGADGLVCSPWEVATLRASLGVEVRLVTPGIRPSPGADAMSTVADDDQRRVATPEAALAAGADDLVIGRPITRSPQPRAVVDALYRRCGTAKPR